MKARDAVVQTIGVAVRGPGAFVPATEAALQICGVQVRVKGAGVQGAELVPGACGPAVRAAGPACWASGPVVILCATHVILSAAKDPYRGRSDPSRAQDDDTPAQDDDTPAQDDDTRNRDDNSLADPLCVSPSKLPKVNPPSMNILELENHRRNGTPRVSSVSRFQTHLSSSSGRSGNLWEPRSGQSRQSAAEPATGYRYPEGHATVTRGAVEDQCTDPEGGTAACLKDVAGTRTRQSASTAGQYFNPLASAKSRIAFSCSSVSFSGTSTSTCTMRSPTCSPFLIP
jgi:hypothetical protein